MLKNARLSKQKEQEANCFMHGCELQECQEKKDLDLLISDDLKVGSQCNQAFLKANRMLGVPIRTVVNKSPYIL